MQLATDRRACVVCQNGAAAEPYSRMDQHEYVRCAECGLVYVDRIPPPGDQFGAYTGGWLRSLRRKLTAPYRQHQQYKNYDVLMRRARTIFAFGYASLTPAQRKRQLRFLDIGCNRGFLLAAAAEHSADVYGVELVPEIMVPFANTYPQFKHNIYSDKLSAVAARFADGFFDLITAIDVVEHFDDPVSDMTHIHRILKDDGVWVIQTPDIGCERARELRDRWGALKPLEHLHLFDTRNFARLAKRIGFRGVRTYEPFEEADGNFVAILTK
jgi:2-polyprenyl-3-methyl-5-hydroxy-6-metoxy-1,4-benzoquinol methylase